jgi:hypothetical protein
MSSFPASAQSQKGVSVPHRGRSRLTNHVDLLPHVTDGRAPAARRFRDLVRRYVADQGGADRCSEVRLGLLRRLAAATVLAEVTEAKLINGEPVDITELCTLTSTVVRIASRVGLDRVPREVESIEEYLRKYADDEAREEAAP